MIEKKSLASLRIKKDDIGIRLDKILLKKFNSLSFIKIQKLIRIGFFKVNNRKVKSNLSFVFGTHICLGASQTRSILRIMLKVMSKKLSAIEVKEAKENIEDLEVFQRKVGFNTLKVQFKS